MIIGVIDQSSFFQKPPAQQSSTKRIDARIFAVAGLALAAGAAGAIYMNSSHLLGLNSSMMTWNALNSAGNFIQDVAFATLF